MKVEDRELLLLESDSESNFDGVNNNNNYRRVKEGITLAWKEVNVYASVVDEAARNKSWLQRMKIVSEKRTFKRILDNVSGCISSGTLMGIMGSSGAGKSTLMTTLAHRRPQGTVVHGDIVVNGQPVGPFMNKMSGFVYQDDIFIGTLTVREHLTFMIQLKLRQRLSREEINARISEVMARAVLNLNVLDRKIGEDSDFKKVLSGGEKKRLSIATELISDPLILFCDEPTTGLDSFNAQQVMATMKDLARAGQIIICTIHQPSESIFEQMDEVMFLSDGRLAFTGTPAKTIEFFGSLGMKAPTGINPAVYLMSSLSGDGHRSSKWICDHYAVTPVAVERDARIQAAMARGKGSGEELWHYLGEKMRPRDTARSFLFTIFLLTYRNLLNARRNPSIQILRMIQKVLIAVVCGMCYFGSLKLDQLGIQAVQGAIFITISENTFHAMYAVVAIFPNEFPIFIRERKSGLYSIVQYYVGNILGMLPGLLAEPLAFVCIFYFLVGFQTTIYGFFITCLVTVMVINVACACGYFFSVTFNSVAFGMAYLVPFDYILMITSGVFIKLSTLPWFLQWMKFMSWFMYASESLTIVQWRGVTEIACPEDVTLPCLRTGQEVLDRYSFSADNLGRDLGCLFAQYFIFHILGMFFLYKRTK